MTPNPFSGADAQAVRNPQLSCLRGLVRAALYSNDFVQAGHTNWPRTQSGLRARGEIHIRVGRKSGLTLAAISVLRERFIGRRVLWVCGGGEAQRVQERYVDADVISAEAFSEVKPRLAGPYTCVVLDPGAMFTGLLGKEFRALALEVADPSNFRLLVLG